MKTFLNFVLGPVLLVFVSGCASTQNDVNTEVFYPNGQPAMKHTDKSRTKGIRNPGHRTFGGGGTIFRATGGIAVGGAGDMPLLVDGPPGYGNYPVEIRRVPLGAIPAEQWKTMRRYGFEDGDPGGGYPTGGGYGYHR